MYEVQMSKDFGGEMDPKWVFHMLLAWMLACACLMLEWSVHVGPSWDSQRCKVEVLLQCDPQNEWLYENEEGTFNIDGLV